MKPKPHEGDVNGFDQDEHDDDGFHPHEHDDEGFHPHRHDDEGVHAPDVVSEIVKITLADLECYAGTLVAHTQR